MAKLEIPIRVDGIKVMQNVIGDIRPQWDPDVPRDYQQGFADCLKIVRKVLDKLEDGNDRQRKTDKSDQRDPSGKRLLRELRNKDRR